MNGADSRLGSALKRHEKLRRRPLGELVGSFVKSTSTDSQDFAEHLAEVVDIRNNVVHHFDETFGLLIAAGNRREVIVALETQWNDPIFPDTVLT
jgi:hypothetical protein